MALGVDGLVSGLDTTALINSLMGVEALPQRALQNKSASTQSLISAFQKLNSSVSKMADLAKTTAKPDALEVFSTTSSAPSVTVTASAGATPGDLELRIGQTALAQRLVSAPLSAWPEDPPVLTIVKDGKTTEITAGSTSLADIATAVGRAGIGVSVSQIWTGTDQGTGKPVYRLQFTGAETGTAHSFTVHRGTAAQVAGGTAVDLATETGAAVVQTARDASITLWEGSPAQQVISSASNTFEDVLPGVDISITAAEAAPVRVAIARDESRAGAVVKALVSSVAEALAQITVQSSIVTTTGEDGKSKTRGGPFTGDPTVRDVASRLRTAAMDPVGGHSPSEFGIVLTKTGNIEFNQEKFAKALRSDPAGTAAAIAVIAGRVENAAVVVSDKFEGTLTARVTGQEKLLKEYSAQILEWDGRLERRRATLERVYSAMEVQLGQLNSQSSWLASQLGSLSSQSSGTKN
jgi:flagellar hook-associated protein 2